MSTRRIALIGTVLAALTLLVPAAGTAVFTSGCGAEHIGRTSCEFTPSGVGLTLSAIAPGSWVTVTVLDPVGHTLASCYGYDGCSTSFAPIGVTALGASPLASGGPLTCLVDSDTAGSYSCSSYLA